MNDGPALEWAKAPSRCCCQQLASRRRQPPFCKPIESTGRLPFLFTVEMNKADHADTNTANHTERKKEEKKDRAKGH